MKPTKFISYGITQCKKLAYAFKMEYIETKAMLTTFRKLLGKRFLNTTTALVTEQEEQEAYTQLWDLPKMLPFLLLSFLPIPGIFEIYILLAFGIEKIFGAKVNVLPSQIKKVMEEL